MIPRRESIINAIRRISITPVCAPAISPRSAPTIVLIIKPASIRDAIQTRSTASHFFFAAFGLAVPSAFGGFAAFGLAFDAGFASATSGCDSSIASGMDIEGGASKTVDSGE